MSLHDGHRRRMKDRFQKEGLDHFEKHQVLELLLFYCLPRQDTNPIAHRLLEKFGSVDAVMNATPAELKEVEGVGENVVQFLRLFTELQRYRSVEQVKAVFLNTIDDCGEYILPFFSKRRNETVFLLCLDAKCKLLSCKMVGEGSVNSAGVPIRRIVETAMNEGASTVVLAHNHPSGYAVPSSEDIATTRRLARALSAVEIVLADHFVVADGECVSMVQSGMFDPRENDVYAY